MIVLVVLLYFALVAVAAAALFLPTWRASVHAAVAHRVAVMGRAVRKGTLVPSLAASKLSPVRRAGADAVDAMRPLRWWWAAGATVVIAAPGMALVLRHWNAYDGFDHTYSREADARVAALLVGEQLVPPPRLPPELFATREVEQAHPLATTASRQWELLDGDFRQRLLLAFKLLQERHGYEMVLIEGYRSPERQAQLASLGPQVTHAGAGQSYHQVGLAADCAFLKDGRVVINERDPWAAKGYELYGAIAQSVGLTWGGNWRGLADLGHVELPRSGALPKRNAAAAADKTSGDH